MCWTGPFEFRWLKGYIYKSSYYHHQIGSIHLSHCCHIFLWLCVWDGCTTIFCHLLSVDGWEFETFQPQVATLLIGGNDVLPIGDSDLIAHPLVAVAATLKRRFGLEPVNIIQILPRFIRASHKNQQYNRLARASNKRVLSEVKQTAGISLIQLDFARFKCEIPVRYHHLRQFYWDRVHLNWRGYKNLCQALRDAVIQASQLTLWSKRPGCDPNELCSTTVGPLFSLPLQWLNVGYVCIIN